MKHTIIPIALAVLPLLTAAQELPAPSPKGKLQQRVGLTDVTIEYSRPSAKDRKIFGGLVPYGKIWRTGANNCTTIEFSGPVMIENETVPKGRYAVFTQPEEGYWMFILNSDTSLTDPFDRKPELDILTTKVGALEHEYTETFTIDLQEVKDDKARMDFRWEKLIVSVLITADATQQSIENIEEALAKPDATFRNYASSARFYLDRGLGAKQALAWAQKSVSMEKRYWNLFTLARAQHAVGDPTTATATAQEAIEMARAEKDDGSVTSYKMTMGEWGKQ